MSPSPKDRSVAGFKPATSDFLTRPGRLPLDMSAPRKRFARWLSQVVGPTSSGFDCAPLALAFCLLPSPPSSQADVRLVVPVARLCFRPPNRPPVHLEDTAEALEPTDVRALTCLRMTGGFKFASGRHPQVGGLKHPFSYTWEDWTIPYPGPRIMFAPGDGPGCRHVELVRVHGVRRSAYLPPHDFSGHSADPRNDSEAQGWVPSNVHRKDLRGIQLESVLSKVGDSSGRTNFHDGPIRWRRTNSHEIGPVRGWSRVLQRQRQGPRLSTIRDRYSRLPEHHNQAAGQLSIRYRYKFGRKIMTTGFLRAEIRRRFP